MPAVVTLLAAGIFGATVPPAQADVVTFNPFEVNDGFTVLAQGDAVLGNGELEGSVAAVGSLSSTRDNYPVRHHVAGRPDYEVPYIDGDPVRILAKQFTGGGGIDVTNDNAPQGSPESRGIAKFVDTNELALREDGGQFTRVVNAAEGRLDLKALPHADDVIRQRVQADLDSVGAYFDIDDQLARTSQCLSAMYDPTSSLVNVVDVTDHGNQVQVTSFDDSQPNVLFYDKIHGKTIKLEDAAAAYVPSAAAPLIIKVPAGTTNIGHIDVEGWSADANAQQAYARHILLDLSEVTGTVTIDGLELGSIWAPHADLVFSSGVNTNGQWFAKNVTTAGGGEIHHHEFLGELPCLPPPPPPGGFTLAKAVAGAGAPLVGSREFVFDVTIGGATQTVQLANGRSRSFTGLAPGTRVSVTERPVAAPDGAVFDGVQFTVDGAPVDTASISIDAGTDHAIIATNTFSTEPSPVLTLVKNVPHGDPADWTLTATAPDGTKVLTGHGAATGTVTAGTRYTLAESGGPAEYVQDGDWQCTRENDDGATVPVDVVSAAVVVPRLAHVTCTVTNVTARLTLLKMVTGDTDLVPADWDLSATPSAGVDGLSATTVRGGESPRSGNTFLVRPEHDYVLSERPGEGVPGAALQIAVERYVGPAPGAPDHAVPAHWERVDPAAISVEPGAHAIYRFINFVPSPIELPALGGLGSTSLLTGGAAVMSAGLAAAGVVLHRRRTGA